MEKDSNAGGASPEMSPGADDKKQDNAFMAIKAEKKKLQAELEAKTNALREIEEAKLKETNQWKLLAEQKEQQWKDSEAKRKELEEAVYTSLKKSAFNKEVGGGLARDAYYSHVDFESIAFNPETKSVDQESVKMAAQKFAKEFPELLGKTQGKMPSVGGGTAAAKKSVDEMTTKEIEEYIRSLHAEGKLK